MQSSAPESDHRVQQLLRDVAQGRKRDGALGAVTLSEEAVEEAIAAFEDWMREGRPGMPCSYWSNTHKVYIKGFVGEMEAEDLLNVNASPQKTAEMKLMGEPANIRPREEAGWYVPPLPEAAAKPEADCKQTLQRVKADFDGGQYGEEYLILKEGDLLENLSSEEGWEWARIVQRAAQSLGPTEGWYPPSFAEPLSS
ncbi:unnamed protein product [Symbiodinium sp. CCMP2592]|nr:unnamed protein product [Symbiodinium sp. CCMP2592]